jgi:hypothetical protein
VALGARLGRHEVRIVQEGAATATAMSTFNLVGDSQTLDTHTALRLDSPNASSNQLHKCIAAAATSRGVFDGNVKVREPNCAGSFEHSALQPSALSYTRCSLIRVVLRSSSELHLSLSPSVPFPTPHRKAEGNSTRS